jgi:hypothetical protein
MAFTAPQPSSQNQSVVCFSDGRGDDVKFVGRCEARGTRMLRIGVTDNSGNLEVQDLATGTLQTWPLLKGILGPSCLARKRLELGKPRS